MATTLYLRASAASLSGTPPSGEQSAQTPGYTATNGALLRTMNATKGAGQTSNGGTTQATTAEQRGLWGMWASDPLAGNQTISGTVQPWLAISESNAAANLFMGYINAYVWRPSTGAKVGTLYDNSGSGSTSGSEAGTSELSTSLGTVGLTSTAALDGDIVVCEVWSRAVQSMGTAYTGALYFDGTDESTVEAGAVTNYASRLTFSQTLTFQQPPIFLAIAGAGAAASAGGPKADLGTSASGASVTASAGASTPSLSAAAAGASAATSAGSVGVGLSAALSGAAASAAAGTPVAAPSGLPSGAQAQAQAGALGVDIYSGPVADPLIELAGAELLVYELAYEQPLSPDVTLALTGQAAAGSAGSMGIASGVAATGASAQAQAGEAGPQVSPALSGAQLTAQAGGASVAVTVALGGVSASALASSPVASRSLGVAGASAGAAAGSSGGAGAAPLTGASATAGAGSTGKALSVPLTGVASAIQAGFATADRALALSGASAAASPGAVLGARSLSPLTGLAATAQPGTMGSYAWYGALLEGIQGAAAQGAMELDRTVALNGVEAQVQAGGVVPGRSISLPGGQLLVDSGALALATQRSLEGLQAAIGMGAMGAYVTTDSLYRVVIEPAVHVAYVPAIPNRATVPAIPNRAVVPFEQEDAVEAF